MLGAARLQIHAKLSTGARISFEARKSREKVNDQKEEPEKSELSK
jgi:hypothetical protein